jgi:NAD(P)-dependent dehydrogenase (short-subunit alcohol dehydrogenase family)
MSFDGGVAVVTGAGSGIGRELVLACAGRGMKVVLADIDEAGMAGTLARIPDAPALQLRCDVSVAQAVEDLADATYRRFGACHLLFNNAGVAVTGPAWTATLHDWSWALGINLMGVVHGIRTFVPRMLAQASPGHVVNTASAAGLVSLPGSAVYCVSKHGVVTLSECLLHDLKSAGADVGVSVLCPAFVATGIADSARHRPKDLADGNPQSAPYDEAMRRAVAAGKLTAADVARLTLEAVDANRFYVLPHRKIKEAIATRMTDILEERAPTDGSRPLPTKESA